MSKPEITMEKFLEIGSTNDFDTANGLFASYDGQSFLACGEARWGRNFAQKGFMHSTDHRAALVKVNGGREPTWLEVYDSWSAGDRIPTQAFLMEPDDGSLSYCLVKAYNSIARGLREWGSVQETGKLSNGKPVSGECASRIDSLPVEPVEPEPPEPAEPVEPSKPTEPAEPELPTPPVEPEVPVPTKPEPEPEPPVPPVEPTPVPVPKLKLSQWSLATLKMLPMKGLKIGPGRASRLQKLRDEIEAQLKDSEGSEE